MSEISGNVENGKKIITVLSIDGGGIRGIIPATILHRLEADMEQPCCKVFDYIVGTSTGGIIALALAMPGTYSKEPKYKAADVIDLYRTRGADIFRPSEGIVLPWSRPAYGEEGIENVLHQYFDNTKLSEALSNVAVTAYNMDTRSPKIFRSWEAVQNQGDDYYMRDVARATSAAPTYFPPAQISPAGLKEFKVHAVDGGVFANNPSTRALVEAMKHEHATAGSMGDTYFALVSLGTGSLRRTYRYKDTKKWGKARWARVILDVVFDGVSDNVDEQLDTLLHADTGIGKFFRFQGKLAYASDDMDNPSEENMERLEQTAATIFSENDALYHDMLDFLRQRMLQRNS